MKYSSIAYWFEEFTENLIMKNDVWMQKKRSRKGANSLVLPVLLLDNLTSGFALG